ncbi:MAG: flagellar hook capping protein [Sphingomonadales bacterium]|nr:flagellar hook capping protein [Sphingomonadales bacterium]MBL0116717.1 flagellar hook capping protein [Sphingomonadales bacterium]
MTSTTPVNGSNIPVVPKGTAAQKLDETAFLRLMTTQLKEQDPFNPVDNTAMVAQMAQFSSVAGISEMNASLKGIADQIQQQTALLTAIQAQNTPTSTTTGV